MSGIALAATPSGTMTDEFGNALAGRRVHVYQRDTTTHVTVWQDEALTTPLPGGNPVTTQSDGSLPGYVDSSVEVDYVDISTSKRRQGIVFETLGGAVGSGPRSGSSLPSPYLRDFVAVDDFKLVTDTDDTNAIQAAANAAIAAGKALYAPGPRTISSTILLQNPATGHPQFELDIITGVGGDASTRSNVVWTWAGGNTASMIKAVNLFNSTWQGIRLSWPDTATGIIGFDIDVTTTSPNCAGNTFQNCHINVTNPSSGTGWRVGESATSAANISQLRWENCKVATGNTTLDGTCVGWRVMGANTLGLAWDTCGAIGCQIGFTSEKDTGGVADGNHSFYFDNQINSHNQIDFQTRGLGSFAIKGGRFEVGQRFLDEELGSTGSDNFAATIWVGGGVEIANYTPSDGIIFKRTTAGALTLDTCHINNSGTAYDNRMITLSCRSTAYGTLSVRGCDIASSDPFFTVSSGIWTVRVEPTNTIMDNVQRATGAFSPTIPDVQVFTTPGTATWTKRAGVTTVQAICIGGGGGGGSGRRGAAASVRCGGGGGGSAGFSQVQIPASACGATETVTVGAKGTGGAAQTVDSTDGSIGTAGTQSIFGAAGSGHCYAAGGSPGAGGTSTTGTGGNGGSGMTGGGTGASASTTGGVGTNASGQVGTGPGAAGGGVTSGDSASAGGNGGNTFFDAFSGGGSAGTVPGGAGGNGYSQPTSAPAGGAGGGGGAASITGAGGPGGNGGLYGAGGGGGGASLNGNNSGKGGDGGQGIVVVTSW